MASILVIDDDKQVRTLLRRVLEQEGYRGSSKLVMAVKASAVAVEMPIDVVITDIFMDQQEELATIRVLHREFPEIKVIAITGG